MNELCASIEARTDLEAKHAQVGGVRELANSFAGAVLAVEMVEPGTEGIRRDCKPPSQSIRERDKLFGMRQFAADTDCIPPLTEHRSCCAQVNGGRAHPGVRPRNRPRVYSLRTSHTSRVNSIETHK